MAEQRAQREAKEDLSKKEARGEDQGPVRLHSTGEEQKHPEEVRKRKSERCPPLTKARDTITSFPVSLYF